METQRRYAHLISSKTTTQFSEFPMPSHADNPVPLTEEHPLRGNEEFTHSRHKGLVEEVLAATRTYRPEFEQVILRIGTGLGETVRNQITALLDRRRLREDLGVRPRCTSRQAFEAYLRARTEPVPVGAGGRSLET
ncbi:hypothetical protein OED52_11405 [Rhodococcus sp. Z13]|uniref:Uncharacterized protein n=1 Tax=Rhodococcus sacchari TaxID=2962047 RepID=A0ACD4DCD3_9NOCA|nr:hypothetical protein [Rhodococcus sp. Z13]UYP17323.1 hypothetical protein OED52_11405 [Rhodococcus sp. Z13]